MSVRHSTALIVSSLAHRTKVCNDAQPNNPALCSICIPMLPVNSLSFLALISDRTFSYLSFRTLAALLRLFSNLSPWLTSLVERIIAGLDWLLKWLNWSQLMWPSGVFRSKCWAQSNDWFFELWPIATVFELQFLALADDLVCDSMLIEQNL